MPWLKSLNCSQAFAPGSSLSAVGFSSVSGLVQSPTTNINGVFIPAIESNPQSEGFTSSGSGLLLCESLISSADDPRIIVLLTDGIDNTAPLGSAVAPGIKSDGITIATVGIGDGININGLQSIASSPDLFTFADSFDTLITKVEEIVEGLCPEPECANIDCAKCGQILECYVNSGFPNLDQTVCNVVTDRSQFCTTRRGDGTSCLQQCKGPYGVECYAGESFGSCPVMIGSNPKCKGGAARNRPAGLSNFASYTVCVPAEGSAEVSCLNAKCESGSSCSCAQSFE
ncbi:unnamed protein product [Agarophyton chilense]